jgi:long-chain acyl-CoA synthetase
MYLFGTHRSAARRLRLALHPRLGTGNFFWHVCRIASDLDHPVLYHLPTAAERADIKPYTLRELRTMVLRCVNWYQSRGVRPGTRVGVYTADGLLGLVQHIAITSLGGATVLANPKMAPDVAAHYFRRTETAMVIGDTELVWACQHAWPGGNGGANGDGGTNRDGGTHGDGGGSGPVAFGDARAMSVDGKPASLDTVRYRHRPADLILVSHSSGTTGVPKPASFTHKGFFVGKRERLWNFPSHRTDRLLTGLPHSHSAGISYLSLVLMLGLPTLMIDDRSGAAMAKAMNEFLPTIVLGFPLSLAELPIPELSAAAVGTVHTWIGMGDASHERHIRPLVALGRRPEPTGGGPSGSVYIDGFGSSEMGMVLFKAVHTAASSTYGRLVGKPVAVVRKAAVLDEAGNELPTGQAGLLGVRTPSVTPGYVNDPELTDNARRSGYFLTGDVVRRDERGNFYQLDRTPDVITTADGPAYSLPMEEVVLTATLALDAAVFAVDDPSTPGKSRPAGVVLFDDEEPRPGPEEILARCNGALAERGLTELAALIVATDRTDLPVGVTGKVLKRVLRDRHRRLLSAPPAAGTALVAQMTARGVRR